MLQNRQLFRKRLYCYQQTKRFLSGSKNNDIFLDSSVYSVQCILNSRLKANGKREMLVEWSNRQYQPTWEPEENITSDLVNAFESGKGYPKIHSDSVQRVDKKYMDVNTAAKADNNTLLMDLMPTIPYKTKCVYLEGEDGRTSSQLVKTAHPSHDLIAGNWCRKVYHKLSTTGLSTKRIGVQVECGTFASIIAKHSNAREKQYGLQYWDVCCTFDGNAKTNPHVEIKRVFAEKSFCHNAIFASTFCLRNGMKDTFNEEDAYIVKSIENIAKTSIYTLDLLYRKRYIGTGGGTSKKMLFIVYRVNLK